MLLLGIGTAGAQSTVINGSFENWTGQFPDGWTYLFAYNGFQNVFQSTDAQDGSYSAELKPTYYNFLQDYPTCWMNSDAFSVSSAPSSLKGYYKGTLAGGDSLEVIVIMSNNSVPVGYGILLSDANADNWTPFTVPITYTQKAETPDSAYIMIIVGNTINFAHDGSDIFVDNLTFGGSAGVNDLAEPTALTLYPNPASDRLTIRFSLTRPDPIAFQILNTAGQIQSTVGTQTFRSGQNSISIPVTRLAPGAYLLKALGVQTAFVREFVVRR